MWANIAPLFFSKVPLGLRPRNRSQKALARLDHGRLKNLKAANTKTMPIFAVSRSQIRFLKNRKSTPTMTAAITTT
jgi:hypothetical protein